MCIDKDFNCIVPTNDYVFKRIFGHVGNENITKNLLSSILDIEIKKINLEGNTILEKDLLDDKIGILDIKVEIDNDISCDVEMQVLNQNQLIERILFYWSRLYSSNINEGNNYKKLKRAIVILIADFCLDKLKVVNKYHTEWNLREKDYQQLILTNKMEIHIIELPKITKKVSEDYKNNLINWLKFIKNPEDMEEKEMNQAIVAAKKELDKIKASEYERRIAELRMKHVLDTRSIRQDGVEEGIKMTKEEYEKVIKELKKMHEKENTSIRQDGIEEGIKKGEVLAEKKMVESMISKDISINDIIEITGLTKEKIESLLKKK